MADQWSKETLTARALYGVGVAKFEINKIAPVELVATPTRNAFASFVGGPITWGVGGFARVDKIAREWPKPSPPPWTADFWDYADLAEHVLEDRG